MIQSMKSNWQELMESEPGSRFQNRYNRRQQDTEGRFALKVFYIILGTVIAVGSLFTAPLPGPGFATVLLGLAILAGELRPVARFLDWAEVRLRKLWQSIQNVWRTSVLGKVAIVAVAALLVGALAYVAYFLLFVR